MVNTYLLLLLFVVVPCIRSLDALENGITKEVAQNLIPCREGWHFFGGKCYKVEGESKGLSWEQASAQCSKLGGKLATIYSKEMQDYMFTFLFLNAASDVWIGLNDRAEEGKYVWDDGSPFNYTAWEPGEPSGQKFPWEDCVVMRFWTWKEVSGMWNDCDCIIQLPYMCQQMKDEKYQNPDPRFCSAEKGGGWKYLNSCYHIVTEEKTWKDAERYCEENFNGHLATVLDFRAEYFLNSILSNYNQPFWYGIKTQGVQQQWSSGWQVIFNRWDENTPFAEDTCALRTSERTWKRECCALKHSFVCEASTDKPPVEENGHCPETSKDWVKVNGKFCYFLETKTQRTWNDANYDCMSKGGTLVNTRSKEEHNALFVFMKPFMDILFFHIGLRREPSNKKEFRWTDGSKLSFQSWNPGQPDNINEECVEILTTVMKWNDLPCSVKRPYICSASKVPPPEPEEKLCTCALRENITEIIESAFKRYVLQSKNCTQD